MAGDTPLLPNPDAPAAHPERNPAAALPRRRFLSVAGAAVAAVGMATALRPAAARAEPQTPTPPPGEPALPPGVDLRTIVESEKLARLTFNQPKREQILKTLPGQLELIDHLRTAPLANSEAPAELFDPRPSTARYSDAHLPARFRTLDPGPVPSNEEDIAFASLPALSHWIETRQISSVRLTRLYLDRLKQFGPKLECVITLTEDLALAQAKRADAEIAAGKSRGPLHGIPCGFKDLFDTKGIATTWGAEPYRSRIPDSDAAVVRKLDDAGAVLLAKLTLGALAYGDIWFGGKTRNPWKPEQGSSGSSAGSAAATAAGLVAFSLGTETYGSIASPSARCGTAGFRPTFGRVSRAGAMALCWSLDKVGPICRSSEDCAIVLDTINGPDPQDPCTTDVPLNSDTVSTPVAMRIGYVKSEYDKESARDADRATLKTLERLGHTLVPIEIPKQPYGDVIFFLISVEAAAAFDELTRTNLDETLKWQDDEAWPNVFRMTRLAPAVEYMQARRLRRRFMTTANDMFAQVDAMIAPAAHETMHALTNMTGHPAITIRQGFRDDGTPFATTLWGRLYEDAKLLRLASSLEKEFDVASKRPTLT